MGKTGKLCLFEGKMFPISEMMKMYQRCQPDVDMLIFFMSSFTEEGAQRTFWVSLQNTNCAALLGQTPCLGSHIGADDEEEEDEEVRPK